MKVVGRLKILTHSAPRGFAYIYSLVKICQRNALHLSCCVSRDQIPTRLQLGWKSGLVCRQRRIEEPQLTSRFSFLFCGIRDCEGVAVESKMTPFLFFCMFVSLFHTHMRSFGMGHLYWIGIQGLETLSGLENSTHSMVTMIMTLRCSRNTERVNGKGTWGPMRNQPHVLRE